MAAKEQFDMADVVQYRHAPLGATETMHDTMLGQSLAINPGWYYDRKVSEYGRRRLVSSALLIAPKSSP